MVQDILRSQVQSELNTARKKIEAIVNEIETCESEQLASAFRLSISAIDTNALARQRGSPPITRRGPLQRDDSLRKGRNICTGPVAFPHDFNSG